MDLAQKVICSCGVHTHPDIHSSGYREWLDNALRIRWRENTRDDLKMAQ